MRLVLDRLTKRFGLRLVFKDITLHLEEGCVLLVTGSNGAGKSTLLKIIAGLERPSSGIVDCRAASGRLSYLGHQTGLYPQFTALENLRFAARLYGLPREASVDAALLTALGRVGLHHVAKERAERFSRGMAQRLALARSLLLEPELLLLDEPATGLDRYFKSALHREITVCRTHGASIVWVSHNLEQDLPLADWLLVLGNRRQAFFGTPAECPPAYIVEGRHAAIVDKGAA